LSNTQFDPIADVTERIEFARRLYLADLRAMPAEMLSKQCGGRARTAYDITFELVGMSSLFTELLTAGQGEIPRPDGWITAPPEFQDPQGAMSAFDAAQNRFLGALRGYAGDVLTDEYASPVGAFTPLAMANLMVWHTMYHSGQLNFIQTLCGDDQFHWLPE
jgi:hypothetical protein